MSKMMERRKKMGLTREDLASRTGLSASAIERMERRIGRIPKVDNALAIAKVLGTKVEHLWTAKEKNK